MSLTDFSIIESTLREGEQFVNAFFSREQKIRLATMLDAFGVEYLELTSPLASPASREDCATIASLGLRAKVLTHVRCKLEDARIAVETGVDGVDVVIGTSSKLREFSHGRSIDEIVACAREVVPFLKDSGVEVRFSTEDTLRSETDDLFRVYEAVDELGVHRVGIADTIGIGTPLEIHRLVSELRARVSADIEFHGHDDTGCAIANSYAALDAGATHIDTSVLGIGERNGITPLGGFVARMMASVPEVVRPKYRLNLLLPLDQLVAKLVGVDVPFNEYVTGFCAFTHKAGIHAKAVLNDPSTYEVLDPADFGLTRYVHIAHRLTGWNALKYRADQLGLELEVDVLRELTARVKEMADRGAITLDNVDALLQEAAEVEPAEPLELIS